MFTDRFEETNSRLKSISGQGIVELAIQHDYHEIIRVILEDLDVSFDREFILREAIQNGSPKIIKMVLNYDEMAPSKKQENIRECENSHSESKANFELLEAVIFAVESLTGLIVNAALGFTVSLEISVTIISPIFAPDISKSPFKKLIKI